MNNASVACHMISLINTGYFFLHSPPFVLDPANPPNNVCSTSNAEGWKIVVNVAKMTLRRQQLKDVIFNKKWQII